MDGAIIPKSDWILVAKRLGQAKEKIMAGNYRIYYHKGDLEIEIESTDKDYVDQKLEKLLPTTQITTEKQKSRQVTSRKRKESTSAEETETVKIDVACVVARIHDADNFTEIEKNILDKSAQLPRILLVCKFAHEYGHDYITTGDIEALTDELGIKIASTNASNCIADNRKYFTAKSARKKGAVVLYKLNRQGEQALEKYLNGEKSN